VFRVGLENGWVDWIGHIALEFGFGFLGGLGNKMGVEWAFSGV
jgi:hypothetical protein